MPVWDDRSGFRTASDTGPALRFEVDAESVAKLQHWFAGFPKDVRRILGGKWRKIAKAIDQDVSDKSLSSQGPQTVGPGPFQGKGYRKGKWTQYRTLKDDLYSKVKTSARDSFGAYAVVEFHSKNDPIGRRYLARWLISGTNQRTSSNSGYVRVPLAAMGFPGAQGFRMIGQNRGRLNPRPLMQRGFSGHENDFQQGVEDTLDELLRM